MLLLYLYRYTSRRQAIVILLATYALVTTVYLAGSIYYYHAVNRHHWFDPYYQVSPPEFKVPKAKAPDEYRIIALGGSTTRDPRKKEDENYPYLLQQMLQARYPGKKITVLNGGMNWFSAKHTLMFYTEYAHLFNPDLVIVMDGINDLYRSFSPRGFALGEFQPDYSHFYGASINGALSPTFENAIYARDADEIEDYKKANFPFSEFLAFNSFKQFESSLVKYIKEDSTKCLLIMQPSLYRYPIADSVDDKLWFGKYMCNTIRRNEKVYPDAASMKIAMDSFITAVKNISIQQNCLLLNADSAIPKTPDYFTDDVHYTRKGDRALARLAYGKIVEQGLIDTGP